MEYRSIPAVASLYRLYTEDDQQTYPGQQRERLAIYAKSHISETSAILRCTRNHSGIGDVTTPCRGLIGMYPYPYLDYGKGILTNQRRRLSSLLSKLYFLLLKREEIIE